MRNRPDPAIGSTYGRLTVLSVLKGQHGHCMVDVRCSCGTTKAMRAVHILCGVVKSCGCWRKQILDGRLRRTHGATKSPEHQIWCGMRQRCLNSRNKKYGYYGGRGIAICDDWSSFAQFFKDMGPRPTPKHSLDRIDVNKGYSKSNCRWATASQQMRNTRSTTLSSEMAETIRSLCRAGMSKAEAARVLEVNYSSVKQVAYGKQWA